jgi:hypothetical protein
MTTTTERPAALAAGIGMARFKTLGYVMMVIGLAFLVAVVPAGMKIADGYDSLNAFSEAEGVALNYNEDGQLVDRGTTEGADNIMALLTEDWAYPVVESELDPDDPIVNTASEYMFQMATIMYHVLHGTQTVVLEEDVEYNGEIFTAGTYEVPVDGKYWSDFDRRHPLEGPTRSQAWSGTAHALTATLGVGTVTATSLQLATALAALVASLGGVVFILGAGLVWASKES